MSLHVFEKISEKNFVRRYKNSLKAKSSKMKSKKIDVNGEKFFLRPKIRLSLEYLYPGFIGF